MILEAFRIASHSSTAGPWIGVQVMSSLAKLACDIHSDTEKTLFQESSVSVASSPARAMSQSQTRPGEQVRSSSMPTLQRVNCINKAADWQSLMKFPRRLRHCSSADPRPAPPGVEL